jgi:pimeloyl-ACP methyl ester carboxylesterase
MGPIALLAGPSSLLAALAANQWIPEQLVPEVIPGTSGEKWGVWHRAAAVSRQSAPAVLRNTTIHCVALHGTRDLLVPVSVLARLKAALPEGTLTHAIKGAGHVPYLTHVGECVALLVPWLAALRIGSRDAA